jgi:AraC-like DNA-binding protein
VGEGGSVPQQPPTNRVDPRLNGSGPTGMRIEAGWRSGERSPLFERLTRFAFADHEQGFLHLRGLRLGSATAAYLESGGHDVALVADAAAYVAPLSGRLHVETAQGGFAAPAGGGVLLFGGADGAVIRGEAGAAFRALVATAPRPVRGGQAAGRAMAIVADDPLVSGLHGFVAWLLEDGARPDSPVLRPAALQAAEAMLRDFFAELDAVETADAPDGAAQRLASADRVRRATELMRARSDQPITVDEIAATVGLGRRALQMAFRETLDASPRSVLTDLRLDRAQARLLSPAPGLTVAEAARASGFTHPGRFAAAYRRRFGESPAATLRRALGD